MNEVNQRCFDLAAALRNRFPGVPFTVEFIPDDTNWIDIQGHTIAVRADSYSLTRAHARFRTSNDLQTQDEVVQALILAGVA